MSSNRDFDREVTFEIVEEIGVIATHSTGWKKELNLVSWNGGQAKYDIRDWDPGHSRMSRGVTLKEQEMRQIVELLRRRRPHRRDREPEQGVMVDTPMDPAESFAEAPASSVSDGQSQAVPAANLQSQETQQPGDVGNSDPQIGSCFYIDVVVAGRCAADVFQLRAVFHQFACDGTFTGHEDLISRQAGKSLVF